MSTTETTHKHRHPVNQGPADQIARLPPTLILVLWHSETEGDQARVGQGAAEDHAKPGLEGGDNGA